MKISTIIPAYNEEKNITNVLNTIRVVPNISEIIVVDDGSTDETAKLVQQVADIILMSLPKNVGKTKAVIHGVASAKDSTIMFLDADLQNLTQNHVLDLIKKYRQGFDMVIMDKGSQPWVFRRILRSVPAVSGTRILDKKHFWKVSFKESDRFKFEIRLNDYFLNNNLSIGISQGEGVYDPRKYVKYSFLKGMVLDIKGGVEALASDGFLSIFRNLVTFRKINALEQQ